MRSDPYILITCDQCSGNAEEVRLMALAGDCYDERNVDAELERRGWQLAGGREICPECVEENQPAEGGKCPQCGSNNVATEGMSTPVLSRPCRLRYRCKDCRKRWVGNEPASVLHGRTRQ